MSRFSYGGQAVIEGVMMRGKHCWAVAVRKGDREVTTKHEPLSSLKRRFAILRRPLLRGIVSLFETLVLGMQSLSYSANESLNDNEEPFTLPQFVVTVVAALLLTIGLFVILPAAVTVAAERLFASRLSVNIVEGAVRAGVFLLYVLAISGVQDIQRVFQYHGAEHKTINCWEAGEPLTVENVRRCSRVHLRCGTNFLLIVLIMGVLVFSFFGRPPFLERVVIHLLILPITAGLAYELIRQAGAGQSHFLFRWLAAPGMALQQLTTREPDDQQIGVAIAALNTVIKEDALHSEERKVIPFPQAVSEES